MIKRTIIIVVGIALLSFLINGAVNWLESQPTPPDQKFAVVDKYKNCNVVQYSPTNAARYQYFLDCSSQ
jgi:hypothetical protein